WQNLYYGMHLKYNDPKEFGFEDLLRCIQQSYEYTSELLRCKLGRLEKGYEADMLLIPYEPPTPMNGDNIFGHLFFGLFSNFRPRHVWCEGQQLVTDYRVSPLLEHTYQNAKVSAKKVWERINETI
nr:amidohydrolase [Vallitaleaceae bacterium]